MIYHITSRAEWEDAQKQGCYSNTSLASEGFIHCSRRDQILSVVNDFYRGKPDLLLLCIDEDKVQAELRWESPVHPKLAMVGETSHETVFPHLYGTLKLDAVVAVLDFVEADAGFALPANLP